MDVTLELSELSLIELGRAIRQRSVSPEKDIMLSHNYFELKKLWHDKLDIESMSIANDIADAVSPTDLINRLRLYLDMSASDKYNLGVQIDEFCTVRLNRLLKYYSRLGDTSIGELIVESFIGDYDELIGISYEYSEGNRIKDAVNIMLRTLKSEHEYMSIDQKTKQPVKRVYGIKKYFSYNKKRIYADIASYKEMLNVNVAFILLHNAFLYTDNIIYGRELRNMYKSVLLITPDCALHKILTNAYQSNFAFQQNKYATLVIDVAYTEDKLYEVYVSHDGNFRIVPHYVN
jgi:hypothetical protein